MNYLIYFDESNKIDQHDKKFSYYGAYGGTDSSLASIVKKVYEIYKQCDSREELHFREYRKDTHLKKYFLTLHTVINENIRINILIVNNEMAYKSADRIGLNGEELRNLFYIKIPERLFYGLTRDLPYLETCEDRIDVKIKIDRNYEYDKIELNKKLIEQMNAHSAYRNKNYRINKVISHDSEKSIPLQIIDTFIGIVVFLLEKTYLNQSNTSKIKSDLIYRFLIQDDNMNRFQNQIKLFEWTGEEELKEVNILQYLSPFIIYKTNFDIEQIVKVQTILSKNPNIDTKKLRKMMGYPNTMLRLLQGYIDQITGIGRNSSLFY